MRKKTFLITTLVLMGLMYWVTAASAKEVTLIFATGDNAMAHKNVQICHPWAQRINEQGKGIIKIDVRDGYTLINHMNFYQRTHDNVVQIAWGIIGLIAGKFDKTNIIGLPYMSPKSEINSVAYWRLYKSGLLDDEYDEIVPLYVTGLPNSSFHFAKPLKSIDNFNGLKMTAGTKLLAAIVREHGATPISLPLPDYYEALQRGTLDGIMMSWTGFQPFKLAEVTKYHIETQLGGAPGAVFMMKKVYDSLPPEAQKIIQANSGEAQSRAFGAFWDRVQEETRKQVEATKGHTIVTLTPEQMAEWRKRDTPHIEEWIKSIPGGEKVYVKFAEIIKQVEAGN